MPTGLYVSLGWPPNAQRCHWKGLRYPRLGDAVTTLPLKGLCITPEGFPENYAVLVDAFLCTVLEMNSSLRLVYSRARDQIIPLV